MCSRILPVPIIISSSSTPSSNYGSTSQLPRSMTVSGNINGTNEQVALSGIHSLDETEYSWKNFVCGRRINTYPWLSGSTERQGSPNCDHFSSCIFENYSICCVADGIHWGKRPSVASERATKEAIKYVGTHFHEVSNLQELCQLLLSSVANAHVGILSDQDEIWKVGTTTLLLAVCVPISPLWTSYKEASHRNISTFFSENGSEPTNQNSDAESEENDAKKQKNGEESNPNNEKRKKYAVVCVSIGDCKAFLWMKNKGVVEELTKPQNLLAMNEETVDQVTTYIVNPLVDPKNDTGGRIGPYTSQGGPDLRNLALYMKPCEEGDLFFLTTDGVYANFDPLYLPVTPNDLGLNLESWSHIQNYEDIEGVRCDYREKKLTEFLKNRAECSLDVTRLIIYYVDDLTKQTRNWIKKTNGQRLPLSDPFQFPGFLDHATCCTCTVGAAKTIAEDEKIVELSDYELFFKDAELRSSKKRYFPNPQGNTGKGRILVDETEILEKPKSRNTEHHMTEETNDLSVKKVQANCHKCKKSIEETVLFRAENQPTCESCFIACFCEKKCHKCFERILDFYVQELGNYWHPEHFLCCACDICLEGQEYWVHERKPFCSKDYTNLIVHPRCFICERLLGSRDKKIIAFNKVFHQIHFSCKICQRALTQEEIPTITETQPGILVCQNCSSEKPHR